MKKKIVRVLGSVFVVTLLIGSRVVFSEPGTSKDPLISKSYVDGKIQELKNYIDDKVKAGGKSSGNSSSNLEIVELRAGQSLIGYGGTEIILRSGRALAIDSPDGGVSDITAGKDLPNNAKIEKNHLLIIPRTDGRGVYSLGETFFMVRGEYSIE